MNIILNLNDETKHLDVEPFRRLLDILRDELAITSVKEGCGKGMRRMCSSYEWTKDQCMSGSGFTIRQQPDLYPGRYDKMAGV